MVLDEFPYSLAGLTVDSHVAPHPVFDATAACLTSKKQCCLDRGMSQKVLSLMGRDPKRLINMTGLLGTLRSWSRHSRLCNMCMERLLKRFTSSSAARCSAERFCCAGFLSQAQSAHLSAGGRDVRKISRKRLQEQGMPLIASRKARCKKRKGSSAQTKFGAWASDRQKSIRADLGLKANARIGSRADYRVRLQALKDEYAEAGGCVEIPEPADSSGVPSGLSYNDRIGSTLFNSSTE